MLCGRPVDLGGAPSHRWTFKPGSNGRRARPLFIFVPKTCERVMTIADKRTVYSDPSDVNAVDGDVFVLGPDAVDVALTPEAAEETSERLNDEAVKARGQRRLSRMTHRPKG